MILLPVKRAPGYFYNPTDGTILSNKSKSGELRLIKPTRWRFENGDLFEGWRLSVKGRRKNIRHQSVHFYVDNISTCYMQVFEDYNEYRTLCQRRVGRTVNKR